MRLWEVSPIIIKNMPVHDVGIILSGVTKGDRSPRDRVHFQKGADRVLHAIQLFRQGKIRKLIVSGGSGLLVNRKFDVEAANIRKTLLLACVPDSSIILETQSKNTHENAIHTAEIIRAKFYRSRLLLITSAFHMRRAEACFRKAGIKATSFSADFYADDRKYGIENLIIPQVDSLSAWHVLFKEWFGFVAYKITGYV